MGAGFGALAGQPEVAIPCFYIGNKFMTIGAVTQAGSSALNLYDWGVNNNKESGKELFAKLIGYSLNYGLLGLGKNLAPELTSVSEPLVKPALELAYSAFGSNLVKNAVPGTSSINSIQGNTSVNTNINTNTTNNNYYNYNQTNNTNFDYDYSNVDWNNDARLDWGSNDGTSICAPKLRR